MRANIRLGLEAGACVRTAQVFKRWNLRPGRDCFRERAAARGLPVEFLRGCAASQCIHAVADAATPVLQSTGSGVEIRTGANSLTLLSRHGDAVNQTVSAQGDIGARYIDGETGAVTINNVYLQ